MIPLIFMRVFIQSPHTYFPSSSACLLPGGSWLAPSRRLNHPLVLPSLSTPPGHRDCFDRHHHPFRFRLHHLLSRLHFHTAASPTTMDGLGLPIAFGKKGQAAPTEAPQQGSSSLPPKPDTQARGQASSRGPRGTVGSGRRRGRGRAQGGGFQHSVTTSNAEASAPDSVAGVKVSQRLNRMFRDVRKVGSMRGSSWLSSGALASG